MSVSLEKGNEENECSRRTKGIAKKYASLSLLNREFANQEAFKYRPEQLTRN